MDSNITSTQISNLAEDVTSINTLPAFKTFYNMDERSIMKTHSPSTHPLEPEHHYTEDKELLKLLRSWSLEKLCDHFLSKGITAQVLEIIKVHHIRDLFQKCDLGTRVIFENSLEKWRNSIGKPLVYTCSSLLESSENFTPHPLSSRMSSLTPDRFSPRSSPYPNSPTSDISKFPSESDIPLEAILKDTQKGLCLKEYYEQKKPFHEDQRSILINLIAQYFDNNNIHMTLKNSYKLENDIIKTFTTEKIEYYRSGKRGKIYTRFCYLKSHSRNIKTINQKISKQEEVKQHFEPEENAELLQRSLKNDNLTVQEFDYVWKACSQSRLQDIFLKWPEYKKPSGYRLIDVDFKNRFKNTLSILDKWDAVSDRLLHIMKAQVSNKQIKHVLEKLSDTNISKNGKDTALLWAMHGYFIPYQTTVSKDTKGKKNVTRFSISDSQQSFCICGKSCVELEEEIRHLKSKSEKIQPFIYAIGEEITTVKEIYVYFDKIRFPFNNILRAVDICIKIFFLFDLKYPDPAKTFWAFIAIFFYSLKSPSNSKVSLLIDKLLQDENA